MKSRIFDQCIRTMLMGCILFLVFMVPLSHSGVSGEDYYDDSILFQDDYWPPEIGMERVPAESVEETPHFKGQISEGKPIANSLLALIFEDDLSRFKKEYDKDSQVQRDDVRIQQLLWQAASLGSIDIVDFLLKEGADINIGTPKVLDSENYNLTALMFAASMGDDEMVRHLLQKGAKINIESGWGGNAVFSAAHANHASTVGLLERKGANVNSRREEMCCATALHIAAHRNYSGLAEVLLRGEADTQITDSRGFTPLHVAAEKCSFHVAKMLILYGAKVDAANMVGLKPIDAAGTMCEHGPIQGRQNMRNMLQHYQDNPVSEEVKAYAESKMGQTDGIRQRHFWRDYWRNENVQTSSKSSSESSNMDTKKNKWKF